MSGQKLAEAISAAGHKNVIFTSMLQKGVEALLREAQPGDAILAIGAGTVNRSLDELALLLGTEAPRVRALQ